jgi:hypothetical protein
LKSSNFGTISLKSISGQIKMKNFYKILLLITVIPFVLFFGNHFYNLSRFRVNKEISKNHILLSSIFPVQENDIKYLTEYYDDNELVGFDCLMDSSLYIKVYNFGSSNDKEITDIITQSIIEPINPLSFFGRVLPPPNEYQNLFETYHIRNLKNNNIERIQIYMGNKILNKKIINNRLIGYEDVINKLSLTFNNKSSIDFEMFGNKSLVSIYFYKNEKNELLFIYINKLPELSSNNIDIKLGISENLKL